VVQLAAFHRLPAVYPGRDFVEIGGLMSYGINVMDARSTDVRFWA
jgi:putative ABC transport system substrate-binding protein